MAINYNALLKKFEEYEQSNYHAENTLMLAKAFGNAADIDTAQTNLDIVNKGQGHRDIGDEFYERQNQFRKLMTQMAKVENASSILDFMKAFRRGFQSIIEMQAVKEKRAQAIKDAEELQTRRDEELIKDPKFQEYYWGINDNLQEFRFEARRRVTQKMQTQYIEDYFTREEENEPVDSEIKARILKAFATKEQIPFTGFDDSTDDDQGFNQETVRVESRMVLDLTKLFEMAFEAMVRNGTDVFGLQNSRRQVFYSWRNAIYKMEVSNNQRTGYTSTQFMDLEDRFVNASLEDIETYKVGFLNTAKWQEYKRSQTVQQENPNADAVIWSKPYGNENGHYWKILGHSTVGFFNSQGIEAGKIFNSYQNMIGTYVWQPAGVDANRGVNEKNLSVTQEKLLNYFRLNYKAMLKGDFSKDSYDYRASISELLRQSAKKDYSLDDIERIITPFIAQPFPTTERYNEWIAKSERKVQVWRRAKGRSIWFKDGVFKLTDLEQKTANPYTTRFRDEGSIEYDLETNDEILWREMGEDPNQGADIDRVVTVWSRRDNNLEWSIERSYNLSYVINPKGLQLARESGEITLGGTYGDKEFAWFERGVDPNQIAGSLNGGFSESEFEAARQIVQKIQNMQKNWRANSETKGREFELLSQRSPSEFKGSMTNRRFYGINTVYVDEASFMIDLKTTEGASIAMLQPGHQDKITDTLFKAFLRRQPLRDDEPGWLARELPGEISDLKTGHTSSSKDILKAVQFVYDGIKAAAKQLMFDLDESPPADENKVNSRLDYLIDAEDGESAWNVRGLLQSYLNQFDKLTKKTGNVDIKANRQKVVKRYWSQRLTGLNQGKSREAITDPAKKESITNEFLNSTTDQLWALIKKYNMLSSVPFSFPRGANSEEHYYEEMNSFYSKAKVSQRELRVNTEEGITVKSASGWQAGNAFGLNDKGSDYVKVEFSNGVKLNSDVEADRDQLLKIMNQHGAAPMSIAKRVYTEEFFEKHIGEILSADGEEYNITGVHSENHKFIVKTIHNERGKWFSSAVQEDREIMQRIRDEFDRGPEAKHAESTEVPKKAITTKAAKILDQANSQLSMGRDVWIKTALKNYQLTPKSWQKFEDLKTPLLKLSSDGEQLLMYEGSLKGQPKYVDATMAEISAMVPADEPEPEFSLEQQNWDDAKKMREQKQEWDKWITDYENEDMDGDGDSALLKLIAKAHRKLNRMEWADFADYYYQELGIEPPKMKDLRGLSERQLQNVDLYDYLNPENIDIVQLLKNYEEEFGIKAQEEEYQKHIKEYLGTRSIKGYLEGFQGFPKVGEMKELVTSAQNYFPQKNGDQNTPGTFPGFVTYVQKQFDEYLHTTPESASRESAEAAITTFLAEIGGGAEGKSDDQIAIENLEAMISARKSNIEDMERYDTDRNIVPIAQAKHDIELYERELQEAKLKIGQGWEGPESMTEKATDVRNAWGLKLFQTLGAFYGVMNNHVEKLRTASKTDEMWKMIGRMKLISKARENLLAYGNAQWWVDNEEELIWMGSAPESSVGQRLGSLLQDWLNGGDKGFFTDALVGMTRQQANGEVNKFAPANETAEEEAPAEEAPVQSSTALGHPTNFDAAVERYIEAIRQDYLAQSERSWASLRESGREIEPFHHEMRQKFLDTVHIETGNKKYLRVVVEPKSVHSFIVNTHDDPKFKYGDILKAAGWKAPAKNFARGNIFGNYTVGMYEPGGPIEGAIGEVIPPMPKIDIEPEITPPPPVEDEESTAQLESDSEPVSEPKPDPYAMKLPKIKKGQKFLLNGEEYTFLRFNRRRMGQKGGRPVVAVKTDSTEFSNLSLVAFRDAKIIEEPTAQLESDRDYESRVEELENEDISTSDAQAIADAEDLAISRRGSGGPIVSGQDDSIARLEAKVRQLEGEQTFMRETNKVVRKYSKKGVKDTTHPLWGEFSDAVGKIYGQTPKTETLMELLKPNYMGKVKGFEGWQLSNNSANLRTARLRLEEELKIAADRASTASERDEDGDLVIAENDDLQIVDSDSEDRIQIFWKSSDGRAPREDYQKLRKNGFVYSRTNNAFQRKRTTNTKRTLKWMYPELFNVNESYEPTTDNNAQQQGTVSDRAEITEVSGFDGEDLSPIDSEEPCRNAG